MSDENDLEALLRFDPFEDKGGSADDGGDGSQQTAGEQTPAPDGGGDAGSQQAGADGAGKSGDEAGASDDSASQQKPDESREPGKDAAGKDTAADAEKEALKEQVRQANTAVARMQQDLDELKKSGKPADDGGSGKPADEAIPSYDFEIPNDIVEGVVAEDTATRQAALRKLVAGMGHSFHTSIRQEVQQKLDAAKNEFQQTAEQTAGRQTQTQQIYTDYFGQYPKHDSEVVRPIVQTKAREVMREWNVQEWSVQVRDEIGRRVEQTLNGAGFVRADAGGGQPPAQPSEGNGNAQQAPHMRRSGASPGGKPGGANSGDDIADTLFG